MKEMDINPCERCIKPWPYHLFIDCPVWLAWAAVPASTVVRECTDVVVKRILQEGDAE